MESLEKANQILKKYNQEHLLGCFEKLSEEKKEFLLNQITSIDYDLILSLYEKTKQTRDIV